MFLIIAILSWLIIACVCRSRAQASSLKKMNEMITRLCAQTQTVFMAHLCVNFVCMFVLPVFSVSSFLRGIMCSFFSHFLVFFLFLFLYMSRRFFVG